MDAATRDRLGDLFCGWYRNRHDDSEINFAAATTGRTPYRSAFATSPTRGGRRGSRPLHRACAIYLLDPPRIELDLLPLGPLPPHRANEARAIHAA